MHPMSSLVSVSKIRNDFKLVNSKEDKSCQWPISIRFSIFIDSKFLKNNIPTLFKLRRAYILVAISSSGNVVSNLLSASDKMLSSSAYRIAGTPVPGDGEVLAIAPGLPRDFSSKIIVRTSISGLFFAKKNPESGVK